MNRPSMLIAATVVLSAGALSLFAQTTAPGVATPKTPEALNFTMKDIDGKEVKLSDYQGKVILMVNVASKCGNTHQYKELEETYASLKDKGFVIMGFPANNFGSQEPGSDLQIKEFCTSTFDVKFPMFSKISVKGNDTHPLYKYLTSVDTSPAKKGDITWNFEKFLIGRDGKVIARFAPKTEITEPQLKAAIETALAAK